MAEDFCSNDAGSARNRGRLRNTAFHEIQRIGEKPLYLCRMQRILSQMVEALIVVDVQNDFCPGGALAVNEGDKVIQPLNAAIDLFSRRNQPVFFTRDWHPPNHVSFKQRGGPWPPHCVQNSLGAEFHPKLFVPKTATIISKGSNPDVDAYSGFQGTELLDLLRKVDAKRVYVGGLATDYCVKNTVLDSIKFGFETYLLLDAVRGVELKAGDSEKAIREMLSAGAVGTESNRIHC
jgi:nicotinamidase/pyrazinamidase